MTLLQNNFEGGTNGTALTTANTGGVSGNPFTIVGGTKGVFDSVAAHGGLSARFNAATTDTLYVAWSNLNGTSVTSRCYVYIAAAPSASTQIVTTRNSTSSQAALTLNTANKIQVQNAASAVLFTTTNALTVNTWYRLEFSVTAGTTTTNGTVAFAYYLGDSTTPLDNYSSGATTNTGTTALVDARFGKHTSSPVLDIRVDDIAANDATTTFIGPYTAPGNIAPTANAGTNQADIVPGATVTLTGTDADLDGTVASRSWRQVSGTAVTLSGTGASRTYTAPSSATGGQLVFGYTVIDNSGAASPESTVTHSVLPKTTTAIRYSFTAENGADNAPITTGDVPGLTATATAGTGLAYSSDQAQRGSKSARVYTINANDTAYLQFSPLSAPYQVAASFYVYLQAYPSTGTHLLQVRNSTTSMGQVVLGIDGKLIAQYNGGTNVPGGTSTAMPLNTWVRIDVGVIVGTTTANGTVRAAWSIGDAAPSWSVDSGPTLNTGTTSLVRVNVGKPNSSGDLDAYYDNIRVDNTTAQFLGAPVSVANAGVDQGGIEPWATVNLTGSGAQSDQYAWTQLSGPGVSLAGIGPNRTFIAPARDTASSLTFGLVVDGSSPQDTVIVGVLPATEFWLSNGVWQPLQTVAL